MGETDTISRQAAIDAIMGQPPEPHYPSWYAAQIEKLPAAQPATNCSEIPNGSDDTISRRAALDAITDELMPSTPLSVVIRAKNRLKDLPSAQPDHNADISKKVERASDTAQNVQNEDLILRKAAIEALAGMIDRFERILADIRASKGDDSVCGMCEYDGAYMGQSGNWCNECPGFDKDDCFKLSDRCRKRWMGDITLPPAQPDIIRCKDCKHRDKYGCCKYWKGLAMADIPIATDDYDFCSYAKRI